VRLRVALEEFDRLASQLERLLLSVRSQQAAGPIDPSDPPGSRRDGESERKRANRSIRRSADG
jgi:hypothetical protein